MTGWQTKKEKISVLGGICGCYIVLFLAFPAVAFADQYTGGSGDGWANSGISNVDFATGVVDTIAPSGGSITYTDGYFIIASVPITYSTGTDSGSGLNNSSGKIQRASAVFTNGSCGVFGTFSDLHTGYDDSPYSDTTVVTGNCYKYQYLISDNYSNTVTYTSGNIAKVDLQAPTTTDDYGAKNNLWQNVNQTITLTPADSGGSGIAWTKYCTDTTNTCTPSAGTAYSVSVVVSTENTSYFRYATQDNAGNTQPTVSRVVKIDTANPIINAGADKFEHAQFTQDATVSDVGSGIAGYLWTKVMGPGTITFGSATAEDTTVSADMGGTYVIRLTATDNIGHSNSDDFTLSWNSAAPVISVTPSDGGSSSGAPTIAGSSVAFTATATDADGDNYYLAVCKTDAITAGNNTVPVCTDGNWCISSSTVSGSQASCGYTTQNPDAVKAWYAFVCDHHASAMCSVSNQGTGDNGSPFVVTPTDAYWVGGAGNWTDAANHWAAVSGGTPSAGYAPATVTTVHFDGNSGAGITTINTDINVTGVIITAGYTGNLSLGNHSIILSGNWTNYGGTFTAGTGTVTFNKSGTQTVNAGASSFNVLSISADTTLNTSGNNLSAVTLDNAGILKAQGGEVITIQNPDLDSGTFLYDGGGTYTLSNLTPYYNVMFNNVAGTWTPFDELRVNNNLTIAGGTLNLNGKNLTVTGAFENTGNLQLTNQETLSGSYANSLERIDDCKKESTIILESLPVFASH